MDMATAYATIANGGRLVSPTGIKRVVQNEGERDEKVLRDEGDRPEGKQVIDPEIAREATEIMIGDVTHGIAEKTNLGDRPVAGKSGTSENFFGSWFIGFTPQLVTGVWMGYAEGGATLEGLLALGSRTQQRPIAPPTVIFQTYMQRFLEGVPVERFGGINGPQTITDAAEQDPPNRPASSGDMPPQNGGRPAGAQQPAAPGSVPNGGGVPTMPAPGGPAGRFSAPSSAPGIAASPGGGAASSRTVSNLPGRLQVGTGPPRRRPRSATVLGGTETLGLPPTR